MSHKKTDFYTLIHKAQRAHLFALGAKIGRADFSDQAEARQLKHEVMHLIAHLHAHAENEATFIHPLFVEASDRGVLLDEEHDDLEQHLHKLEAILKNETWHELYAEFNRFLGAYLLHQDEEERAQVDILWKHCDEEKLSEAMQAFKTSRAPAIAMQDLEFMIPCLSMPELRQLFHGIKTEAPQPAYQAVCQIAASSLEAKRWAQLQEALSKES